MIRGVIICARVLRCLERIPKQVVRKLMLWVDAVENDGLEMVRRVPGFHDEPLHGPRRGQRSIRLSKGYRAIYEVKSDGTVEFVQVEEVTKHAY